MPTMPSHLRILSLALVLVSATVRAQTRDAYFEVTSQSETRRAGTTEAFVNRTRSTFVTLGPAIHPTATRLYSTHNDNSRYSLHLEHPGSCAEVAVVRLGRRVILSEGQYANGDGCGHWFSLDRAQANRAVSQLHVERQDRRDVSAHVHARFAPSAPTYRRGEDVVIAVSFELDPGTPHVARFEGGRQRGPRDNQFSFRVKRDGVVLPEIDGPDFGGIGRYVFIEPGAPSVVRTSLAPWVDLSVPGQYVVECGYDTTMSATGSYDRNAGEWERTFRGTVHFEVR